MIEWHHRLNGQEFGDGHEFGDGQEGLGSQRVGHD